MSTTITLEIPEQLFERARQVAENQHKDVSDVVAQVLDTGLPAIEMAVRSPEKKREIEAFQQLHPMLWSKHAGEYVAIYRAQLVDHDFDRVALLKRVSENYPNDFVLVRQVQEQPDIVYEQQSVRWIE